MTDWPDLIAAARVISTEESATETLEMDAAESSMLTMKLDAAAVVVDRVSS